MPAFAGLPQAEKEWLVRKLVSLRANKGWFGRKLINADTLDLVTMMGTPEATVVTILETFFALTWKGVSYEDALSHIEEFRSAAIPGNWGGGNNTVDYVKYRVRLEHIKGRQMSDGDRHRAIIFVSGFIKKFFAPSEQLQEASKMAATTPSMGFQAIMPDLDYNKPVDVLDWRGYRLVIYEDVTTVGNVTANVEIFKYPLMAVIVKSDKVDCIIAVEEFEAVGTRVLARTGLSGSHTSFEDFGSHDRSHFIARVKQILSPT